MIIHAIFAIFMVTFRKTVKIIIIVMLSTDVTHFSIMVTLINGINQYLFLFFFLFKYSNCTLLNGWLSNSKIMITLRLIYLIISIPADTLNSWKNLTVIFFFIQMFYIKLLMHIKKIITYHAQPLKRHKLVIVTHRSQFKFLKSILNILNIRLSFKKWLYLLKSVPKLNQGLFAIRH